MSPHMDVTLKYFYDPQSESVGHVDEEIKSALTGIGFQCYSEKIEPGEESNERSLMFYKNLESKKVNHFSSIVLRY